MDREAAAAAAAGGSDAPLACMHAVQALPADCMPALLQRVPALAAPPLRACCMRPEKRPGMTFDVTLITPCPLCWCRAACASSSLPLQHSTPLAWYRSIRALPAQQYNTAVQCSTSKRVCAAGNAGQPVILRQAADSRRADARRRRPLLRISSAQLNPSSPSPSPPVHSLTPRKFSCPATDMMTSSGMSWPAGRAEGKGRQGRAAELSDPDRCGKWLSGWGRRQSRQTHSLGTAAPAGGAPAAAQRCHVQAAAGRQAASQPAHLSCQERCR